MSHAKGWWTDVASIYGGVPSPLNYTSINLVLGRVHVDPLSQHVLDPSLFELF